MPYFPFRYRASPWHRGKGFLCQPVIFKKIFSIVVQDVSDWHIGIKKHQRFAFFGCQRRSENTERFRAVKCFRLGLEIFFDLFTVIFVGNKMFSA